MDLVTSLVPDYVSTGLFPLNSSDYIDFSMFCFCKFNYNLELWVNVLNFLFNEGKWEPQDLKSDLLEIAIGRIKSKLHFTQQNCASCCTKVTFS